MSTTDNAGRSARREVRAAVEAILSARAKAERLKTEGRYTEEYIAETRKQAATEARSAARSRLERAVEEAERTKESILANLERAREIDPSRLAIATTQLQMILGNSLQEDPERLLGLYEASFDNPVDRRAVEDLAQKLLHVMPENPQNIIFAQKWEQLKDSLAYKLPEEERQTLAEVAEIEALGGYLGNARRAVEHAAGRLSGEVAQDSLVYGTARHYASLYEKEKGEESPTPTERLPYDYDMGGNRWEQGAA